MTTAEAREHFDDLLDLLKRGETVELTDAGVRVSGTQAEQATMGERLAEVVRKHPLPPEAIDHLERTVRELRASTYEPRHEWPVD